MQSILDIIENNPPLIRWRERTLLKNRKVFLKRVLNILKFLSGNELEHMLGDLFRYHASIYLPDLTRESSALKKIIKHLNVRIKPKNKHFFLRSIRKAGFSFEETKTLGFKFSKYLWKSCLKVHDRDLGGRPQLPKNLANSINGHYEQNSEPSSYRVATKIIKKDKIRKKNEVRVEPRPRSFRERINCRFLNNTISFLQKSFPLNKTILWRAKKRKNRRPAIRRLYPSKRSFFRYRANFFKMSRNKLDLCEYCELGISLTKKIDKFIKDHHPNLYQQFFDVNKYLADFGANEIRLQNLVYPEGDEDSADEDATQETIYNVETNNNNIIEQLKILKQIDYHKYVSDRYLRKSRLYTFRNKVFNLLFYKR